MLIYIYTDTVSSPYVFQVRFTTGKRLLRMATTTQQHASKTVQPQHRYQDSSQSVNVELWLKTSWFSSALRRDLNMP